MNGNVLDKSASKEGSTFTDPQLGRGLYSLLGDEKYSDSWTLDHVTSLNPPPSFDTLIRTASYVLTSNSQHLRTEWTSRALGMDVKVYATKKYKPVDKKVRPVPSYMPNPSTQKFEPIQIKKLPSLPTRLPALEDFVPTERLTKERLQQILDTVTKDFLSQEEVKLMANVLTR